MPRAIALLSGGLDSTLAARIVQRQGFEVEGLNIRTPFQNSVGRAIRSAAMLNVPLRLWSVGEDYGEVLARPAHGYGRGANPCVDCRVYFFRMAKRLMEQSGACLVVSGEVLGQRPMGQKRKDLGIIMGRSGLDGHLLRPLSAKLLPPTLAEREGLIDRERLYGLSGSGRRPIVALARQFGLDGVPSDSPGCRLIEPGFAPRVFAWLAFQPAPSLWDMELVSVGRHVRIADDAVAVVGRNAEENAVLDRLASRGDARPSAFLAPEGFPGPSLLLVGRVDGETVDEAARRLVECTHKAIPAGARIVVRHNGRVGQAREAGAGPP